VASTDTTAMAFGDPDPVTGAPTLLWLTLHNPDVLAQVELPLSPSVPPRVRRAIPLPVSPGDVLRIPRTGMPDLIAVAAERTGGLVIYDTGAGDVVAQITRLGDSPFAIELLTDPGVSPARLAVTVFRSCSLALIEVPLDAPWNATLRGRAGKCS
jgi:hypothetical protein